MCDVMIWDAMQVRVDWIRAVVLDGFLSGAARPPEVCTSMAVILDFLQVAYRMSTGSVPPAAQGREIDARKAVVFSHQLRMSVLAGGAYDDVPVRVQRAVAVIANYMIGEFLRQTVHDRA